MTSASTPKGERRRQALVQAAADLLIEGGFEVVRHRAVAERAGVPLASTTYYFSSLDDLLAEAVRHTAHVELTAARDRLGELAERRRSVDTVVELMLDLLLGSATRGSQSELILVRYERLVTTGRRPALAPLIRELGHDLSDLLAEAFARSSMPVDRSGLARLIALVDGAVVNALIDSDPDPRAAAREMLRAELARLYPDS
ncbi:DNA-binding transcriptional regulator YbjK [Actinoalloteichus hoggarensis]|uniref:Putative DNA-binding transcriptional regulator n=1 Tax=Actinoalloteichus hoggarensis TaxID=1470176 RepID=A0A221WB50_9PSEU|nr:TetR family transcriptional regulator [Actinoalloteichus hoggarensis]ASO23014.1 putative DNA-binding transcriptional regulator [Actinoalloteichus hoggarensis]MBB5922619.1 DNA-binding transcriptional regulator YbjK [Actinoalloteichus hoggarensis]